ncbi:MAG: ATP-binding cassette domain-containing protein [Proteobacteria bacterium]|nr:ATP-binding cassette domain-containing protein [Pseudomonadota bacterium]
MSEVFISANNIHYSVDGTSIFKELDIHINAGEHIGLVGANGTGKSTLLRILAGKLPLDKGEVHYKKGLQIGFVEQFLPETLWDNKILDSILEKMPPQERDYERYRAEMILESLGFSPKDLEQKTATLSGGQATLVMLARAIIDQPDLLLLDEPTNYLDLTHLKNIESFLASNQKTFVVISHDKRFLNNLTTKTVFLRDGTGYTFNLPFSGAKEELDKRDEEALKRSQDEEKQIQRLTKSAKRIAEWGKIADNEDMARKAKSMEKRIEKLQQEKTVVSKGPKYSLRLDSTETRSKIMINVEDHRIAIPETGTPLFKVDKFTCFRGDRVVLLGDNGVGKTTFIEYIFAQYAVQSESRTIYFGPNVKQGYYDQNQNLLDPDLSILESVTSKVGNPTQEVRQELISSGFKYDEFNKRISVLSGGEKARILFCILKLQRPNVIILDEPTNHIDLFGREELENQLANSNATLLITSHDRSFIESIGTRFVLIKDGKLTEIHTLDEYYKSIDRQLESFRSRETNVNNEGIQNPVEPVDENEDNLLKQIELLEKKLSDQQKQKPKFQNQKLIESLKAELKACYETWEKFEV